MTKKLYMFAIKMTSGNVVRKAKRVDNPFEETLKLTKRRGVRSVIFKRI